MTNKLTAERVRGLVAAAERTNKGIDAAVAAQKGFNQLAWNHRHQIIALIEREARLEDALEHARRLSCGQIPDNIYVCKQRLDETHGFLCRFIENENAALTKETYDGRYC